MQTPPHPTFDPPRIETNRLLLRPPLAQDFEDWARFMADAEATRFIGGPQPRAVAWRGFLAMVGAWQIQGFAMFSVLEKASGRWIGRIGPWHPEGWPGDEVGWSLVRAAWGKGYATEAAAAAMDWAFDVLGWEQVIHTIDPANTGSIGVAKRLGSSLIGPGRLPEPYEQARVDVWGQSRSDWRARRG